LTAVDKLNGFHLNFSSDGKPPKLKELLAKIPKATIEKSAEESIRDYENERERLDKFLTEDEERRQQLLEQYSKIKLPGIVTKIVS